MKTLLIKSALFLFLLAAVCSIFSCKKSKKTRSTGYTCYTIHDTFNINTNQWDTLILSTADFPYPTLTAQQQEDTLNANINVPHLWYDCN